MKMKRVWTSILVMALVFTLALTFMEEGETQSPSGNVAAYANAWSIHLGPARYDAYASGSAYAAASPHGAGNAGSWSASAYVYMEDNPPVNGTFANGGGGSTSVGGVYTTSVSASGASNVTSRLGSAADSASS